MSEQRGRDCRATPRRRDRCAGVAWRRGPSWSVFFPDSEGHQVRRRATSRWGRFAFWWVGPLLAVPLAGCTPAPMTEQARQAQWLYNFFMACAAGVFVIVVGLILWSVVRYRDDGKPAPQFHGNPTVEAIWTVLPILLVMVLVFFTIRVQDRINRQAADPAVTVAVTAFQWQWRFDYEGQGIQVVGAPGHQPDLVVPTGRPVHIKLAAADVQHAFFVPAFLFKRDAIPGFVNEFDLTITKPGSYQGECTFICGVNHDQMGFWVRALPPDAFQRWLASHRTRTAAAASGS